MLIVVTCHVHCVKLYKIMIPSQNVCMCPDGWYKWLSILTVMDIACITAIMKVWSK